MWLGLGEEEGSFEASMHPLTFSWTPKPPKMRHPFNSPWTHHQKYTAFKNPQAAEPHGI